LLAASVVDLGGMEFVERWGEDWPALTLQLANLHGDLINTATDDPATTGPDSYTESTEYGMPRDPAAAPDTYGWLGTTQRSTNDLAGLTLMGIRLYNPITGRFLSTDPIPGGNDNPYVYVTDPTDQFDLDGKCFRNCFRVASRWGKRHWRGIAQTTVWVGGIAAGVACGASVVCGVAVGGIAAFSYYAAGNAGTRHWSRRDAAVTTAKGAAGGAVGTWFKGRFGRSYRGGHRGNVPWYW
jgi:RHS repeat-associated protein